MNDDDVSFKTCCLARKTSAHAYSFCSVSRGSKFGSKRKKRQKKGNPKTKGSRACKKKNKSQWIYPPGSNRLSSYTSPTESVIYDAAIAQSRVFDICFTQRREKVSRLVRKLTEQSERATKTKLIKWISTNDIVHMQKKKRKRT